MGKKVVNFITYNAKLGERRGACEAMALSDRYALRSVLNPSLPGNSRAF